MKFTSGIHLEIYFSDIICFCFCFFFLTNEDLREKPESDIWRYLCKAFLFVHARDRVGTRNASVGFAGP